jgi:hypothetical protein
MTDQQFDSFMLTFVMTGIFSLGMGFVLGCQTVLRRRIRDKVVASFVGSAVIPLLLSGIEYLAFRLCQPATGHVVLMNYAAYGFGCGVVGGGFGAELGGYRLRSRERSPEEATRVTHVVTNRPQVGRVSIRTLGPPRYTPPATESVFSRSSYGAVTERQQVVVGKSAASDKTNYERGRLIAFVYFLCVLFKMLSIISVASLAQMPWWERLAGAVAPFAGPALLWIGVRLKWPSLGRGLLEGWVPVAFLWLIFYGLGNLVVSLSGYR